MEKINSGNYVEKVLNTDNNDIDKIISRLQNPDVIRLLHSVMGLATEAGELVDVLKKYIFYGKGIDGVNVVEELGDTLWYVGLAVDVMSTTMDEVMSANIEKLRKRYPEKFTEKSALNRDVDNELSHFKKTNK